MLTEQDVQKLSDLLIAGYPPKERDGKEVKIDQKKVDAALADWRKEIERLKKAFGDKLVDDAVGWGEVFYRVRAAGFMRSPSGFGTPQVAKCKVDSGANTLEFTYAYVLPAGFDLRKRYPMLICLHDDAEGDKDYTGQKYLEEVYLKAPKELRDQFVYLAPNIGPKAGGKEVRIQFGDAAQFLNVLIPMSEMTRKFPVDLDRVFIEGTGRGGELAANLVIYRPHQWAGAALRSSLPRSLALIRNASNVALAFHYRTGGTVTNAKEALATIEKLKADGYATTAAYDALAPAADQKARAGMASDPVHDATGPILTFFSDKKRATWPMQVHYGSDKPGYTRGYWARMGAGDLDPARPSKVEVKVDRASNVVEVTTANLEDFRLLLSSQVVDFDKPIKVSLNGKAAAFDGKLAREFDYFFKYWTDNQRDPGHPPCAQIELVVPVVEMPASAPTSEGGKEGSKSEPPEKK
jgi:hypothetical protein